jgi:hypothetical protein
MSPLAANLKHLYQFRFMWIFHLILVVAISSLFLKMIAIGKSTVFIAPMFFALYSEMIGVTILGTSNKPFSFCLPDHARTVKKMLFTVWLLVTIICLLILPILYLFGIHIAPSLFIAFWGLMGLCFWSGTSICIPKFQFFFLFIIILSVSLILSEFIGRPILPIITDHPYTIVFSSGILSYLIYYASGSRANHRRVCGLTLSGFRPVTKSKKIRIDQEWLYRNENSSFSKAAAFFGTFFTEHIKANCLSGLMPYLWGQIHLIITPIFSRWKLLWIPFLAAYTLLIIVPCFIIRTREPESYMLNAVMLIFFSLAFSNFCDYPRFRSFLLAGRMVHFFQGFVILFTAMLLTLGFLGASLLLCNSLSAIFPKIMLMGNSFTMVWIPWILLIIPFILVPLFGGIFVLFKGIIRMLVISVTAVFAMILSFYAFPPMETVSFFMNLLSVLSVAAITWGFHLVALYYTSMKRSLC